MNPLIHTIVILTLLVVPLTSSSFGQDNGSEIVDSLIKSSDWLEKAWNKSFELRISRRSTGVSEAQGDFAKTAPDDHYDGANSVLVLRDASNKEWIMSCAFGSSSLSIGTNHETSHEEHSNAVYAKGGRDGKIMQFWLPHESPQEFLRPPAQLLERLLDCEVNQLPISVLSMERKPGSDFLDYLVDFCLDPSNKSRIYKEEELVDGVNRLVYRVSMKHSADRVYGIKFVVSANGFDRGLLAEVHYGLIKKDEFKSTYISESQLHLLPKLYTKTDWQEFMVDDSVQEVIVVPRRVSKREDTKQAIKWLRSARYDFDWKPLSEESKQKINLDEAKKKAEELAKDIDKILNR